MDTAPENAIGITISPPPCVVTRFKFLKKWRLIHQCIRGFVSDYEIIPEFDISARLHYHGTMIVKDKTKMFKMLNKMRATLGFIKIEHRIKNWSDWDDYIHAEWTDEDVPYDKHGQCCCEDDQECCEVHTIKRPGTIRMLSRFDIPLQERILTKDGYKDVPKKLHKLEVEGLERLGLA